jgi:hypothetical protein
MQFKANGPPVTVPGQKVGGGFQAIFTIPRGTPGGFWPITARYGGSGTLGSVSTQVKVFTP